MIRLLCIALALASFCAQAQARVVKEMQVTRTGKVSQTQEGNTTAYRLLLEGNRLIVIGDREFFQPATRAALDQAVAKKLSVEIAGHLLIHNDQPPVFALPLTKLDIKGLDFKATAQTAAAPAPAQDAGADAFKEAKLRNSATLTLGQALDAYSFFSSRSWRVIDASKAEFRGEIDPGSITESDSRHVERLRSKNVGDTLASITFVAMVTLQGAAATAPDPAVEVVFQDGTKDRLVWKNPPGYYWDRIYRNKKISLDYFLSKAARNPKYGRGASSQAQ